MATDVVVRDDDSGDDSSPSQSPRPQSPGGGFFTIYKKGQGYWTRMGTAGAAAFIGALIIYNFYQYLPTLGVTNRKTITIISSVFAAGFALLVYWLMNKPANAEFLIATDSEMKKVNWTSRKELFGSTKVVVVFMLAIAFLLFIIDIVFGAVFYYMNVLRVPPLPFLK